MRIEISRRNFHVKRNYILATVLGAIAIALLTTSCGTGDKIGSVSISAVGATGGVVNLSGLGGTIQLHVTANYTSGKTIDETNFATYTVMAQGYYTDYTQTPAAQVSMPAPPLTMTINNTGMITAVNPAVCSWVNLGTLTTPGWAYTGDYEIVATYRGFISQPIFIPLASAASGQANMDGQCGPAQTQ
jgi:hypothetical protein